ncbi:MAG: hypothetical protein K2V38_25570 [Gemmataceae bacterium]|nr:hypothetical protein [Gemmataceae bacterium]
MVPVLMLACAVSLAVALLWLALRRNQEDFNRRFPPISDEEFLRLCRPGTDPEVALKVRRIVADHFAIEYARVHPSMRFIADLGVD